MKQALLILLLLFSSCKAQTMKTYWVYKGNTYCTPKISGTVGNSLSADVIIGDDWRQLYSSPDNSTHKIIGISDLFGNNSIRLGVRRADTNKEGLIAVPYIHNKGKIQYTPFKTATGNLLLKYGTLYHIEIIKVAEGWKISIYENGLLLSDYIAPITISSVGRRLSGMYVEVGSGASLWNVSAQIGWR